MVPSHFARALMGGSAAVAMGVAFAPTSASAFECLGSPFGAGPIFAGNDGGLASNTACGVDATATGKESTAVGNDTKATAPGSVALGSDTDGNGIGTSATGANSTAVGGDAFASGVGSTAVGGDNGNRRLRRDGVARARQRSALTPRLSATGGDWHRRRHEGGTAGA